MLHHHNLAGHRRMAPKNCYQRVLSKVTCCLSSLGDEEHPIDQMKKFVEWL